jgi:hypothetical protein
MKLKESPFKTAKGLCDLSGLLTNAINAVNKAGSFSIEKHPTQSDDDQLEYWKGSDHTYGRWLRCTSGCKLSTPVDFWIGLQIESGNIHIIISFSKIPRTSIQALPESQIKALTDGSRSVNSPDTDSYISFKLDEETCLPRLTEPKIFSGQKEQVLQTFLEATLGIL